MEDEKQRERLKKHRENLKACNLILAKNTYQNQNQKSNLNPLDLLTITASANSSCNLPDDIIELISSKGGNPLTTLRYTKKGNGLVWLEEGDDKSGLQHILENHGKNSNIPGKGKFINDDEIQDLIFETIENGTVNPNDFGQYVLDLGRAIGTDSETKMRVVINPKNGYIRSAYPVN